MYEANLKIYARLPDAVSSVTINGATIAATIRGAPTGVRRSELDADWYDKDHERVMLAISELQEALRHLIEPWLVPSDRRPLPNR